MKLIYPACFYKNDSGYTVTVPDLPGCVTEGDSLINAIEMAQDAASGWILDEMEDGNNFPAARQLEEIPLEENAFVNLIVLDIDSYAEKYGNKAVRKNLTIPAWLNAYAETNNINFSKVLQDSLMQMAQK